VVPSYRVEPGTAVQFARGHERVTWAREGERFSDQEDEWPNIRSFPVSAVTMRWGHRRQLRQEHWLRWAASRDLGMNVRGTPGVPIAAKQDRFGERAERDRHSFLSSIR